MLLEQSPWEVALGVTDTRAVPQRHPTPPWCSNERSTVRGRVIARARGCGHRTGIGQAGTAPEPARPERHDRVDPRDPDRASAGDERRRSPAPAPAPGPPWSPEAREVRAGGGQPLRHARDARAAGGEGSPGPVGEPAAYGGAVTVVHVAVTAVVVAHDRSELLVAALGALADQSVPVTAVVVVDNASSDGSPEAALEIARQRALPLDLVRLPRNTGGAGGFAAGIARALEAGGARAHGAGAPELVWLMDDDTVPTPTALAELLAARQRYAAATGAPPVALASRVEWHDGREHPMNTPRPRPGAGRRHRARRELARSAGTTAVRSASFVSVLLDAAALRAHALPVAAYFLWNDDFEHSTRLLRTGVGLHCPRSVVVHRTAIFGAADVDPGPRFRLEVRNKVWLFTRSRGLAPWEKALYGGATALRWARTLARSRRRRVLLAGLARGLAEGARPPRPTAEVLAGLGPVSDAVAAHEARART